MGRPRIGKRAMTPAERQRRHRRRVEAQKNRTVADERADLAAAIRRALGGVDKLITDVGRAMGRLKKIHAGVSDVSWDRFVRANFGITGKAGDDLIRPGARKSS